MVPRKGLGYAQVSLGSCAASLALNPHTLTGGRFLLNAACPGCHYICLLFLMLKLQSYGRLVAYFRGTEILDRTGIDEAGLAGPFGAMLDKLLEGRSVQIHKSLTDNRLKLGMTLLDIHHHSNRNTA